MQIHFISLTGVRVYSLGPLVIAGIWLGEKKNAETDRIEA